MPLVSPSVAHEPGPPEFFSSVVRLALTNSDAGSFWAALAPQLRSRSVAEACIATAKRAWPAVYLFGYE